MQAKQARPVEDNQTADTLPTGFTSTSGGRDLSIVIPCLNEEASLPALAAELTTVLNELPLAYEIIFVDDGSTDKTFDIVSRLHAEDNRITGIRFRRNFGQTAAFAAGFDAALGRTIVTLDADGQNDPADIPVLLDGLEQGYDVVNGWRRNRQDSLFWRKLPSYLANRLIAATAGVKLRDRGCSLRAFRSQVISELHLYGEMHRFIPEMVSFAGFRMLEVPVNHRPRLAGTSKYGLSRVFRVLLDLTTILFLRRYSDRPMHLFGSLGLLFSSVGILAGLYLSGVKIWAGIQGGVAGFQNTRIGERPLLLLAVLLVILGVQFLVMGLIAELNVRTYYEAQDKPVYFVRETVGRTKRR